MIGLIPKLLLKMVDSAAGPKMVAKLKDEAGVPADREYQIDRVYSDEEWQRLLAAACSVLEVSKEEAEKAFAEVFFADAKERFPTWFRMARNARAFLERQPRIHNCFAAGITNREERVAIGDKFRVEDRNGQMVIHYASPNKLCGLYRKLAKKVMDHYGDHARIEQRKCMLEGDEACEVHLHWESEET